MMKTQKNQPFLYSDSLYITEMPISQICAPLKNIYWKLYCKCTTLLVYTVSLFNLSSYAVIFFSGHL